MLQGAVQQWLGKYQDTAVEYAQQGYDQMQEYVRSNFNDYVEANNLTQVCSSSYSVYPTKSLPFDALPRSPPSPSCPALLVPTMYRALHARNYCSASVVPASQAASTNSLEQLHKHMQATYWLCISVLALDSATSAGLCSLLFIFYSRQGVCLHNTSHGTPCKVTIHMLHRLQEM